MNNCTKANCDCIEKEMQKQGTELIKNYPCLAIPDDINQEKKKQLTQTEILLINASLVGMTGRIA